MTESDIDVIAPVVHGESIPAPEEDITFDERQQQFIDTVLIPRSMGRAAKDVRQELAATKTRLANAEAALKAASPESSETEKLRAELQLARAESESVKAAAAEATRTADIEKEATKAGVIDPALLRAAIGDRVQRQGKDYVILDDSGTPRDGVTLAQFIHDEAEKRPYLVRGVVVSGTGQSGSNSSAYQDNSLKPEMLFGRASDSRLANQTALRNKPLYDRLKISAREKGLI